MTRLPSADRFLRRIADAVARAGRIFIRPRIRAGVDGGHGSKTLANALEVKTEPTSPGVETRSLHIEHFWAPIVHDGRSGGGFMYPRIAKIFVWYKDKRKDPRLAPFGGHTPPRFSMVRRLTAEEFYRDKKLGRLIIARRVRRKMRGSPFFENRPSGMGSFLESVGGPLIVDRFGNYTKLELRPVSNLSGTTKLTLPF